MELHSDVESVLFTEEQLKTRVKEMGAEIRRDYAGKEPVLVSILRGSFMFTALQGGFYGGLLIWKRHQ